MIQVIVVVAFVLIMIALVIFEWKNPPPPDWPRGPDAL